MNLSKKKIVLLGITSAALVAVCAGVITSTSFNALRGASNSFQIKMSSTKNKLTSSTSPESGEIDLQTEEGHDITFSYTNISSVAGNWQCLPNSTSCFGNVDAINGILKIDCTIANEGALLTIEGSETQDFAKKESMGFDAVLIAGAFSYTFKNISPKYFVIKNTGGTSATITDFTITYTCVS